MQPVRLFDWITLAALIVGPLLAVLVSMSREQKRQSDERRREVFRTLMTTRQTTLNFDHVRALNSIEVEFYENEEVRAAWKAYSDVLNTFPLPIPPATEATPDAVARWGEKREQLFYALLLKMARATGYSFDETDIKRLSYRPKGHGELEDIQQTALRGVADVFGRGKPIRVVAYPPPPVPGRPPENPPLPPKS